MSCWCVRLELPPPSNRYNVVGGAAMPVHDWTRVDAGLFHAFHHGWVEELARALNSGLLPADYFALPEQNIRGPIPDVLTLKLAPGNRESAESRGGVAVATRPPKARLTKR